MKSKPSAIIDKMYLNDPFSKWLGIQREEEKEGYVKLSMEIREEMLNGFGIAHGGITYSIADSALAFAANSIGIQSVSIETSISHIKPLKKGDVIYAESEQISLTKKTGLYEVKITNQNQELIAYFKGTVYRTGKEWEI